MSNFNGKIVIKKVVNGEPHIIERSFDNAKEYEQFVKDNNLDLNRGWEYYPSLSNRTIGDSFFDGFTRPQLNFLHPNHHSLPVENEILDKYAKKQHDLRSKKMKHQQETESIKKTIKELEKMQKDFETDDDVQTVGEIKADIIMLEEKLKKIGQDQ